MNFDLLLLAQDYACFYCGKPLGAHTATVDHFIPRCYDGADEASNIVLAHRRCNLLKGDRLPTADETTRFIAVKRRAGHAVWPPVLALADADPGREWIAVAQAVAALRDVRST